MRAVDRYKDQSDRDAFDDVFYPSRNEIYDVLASVRHAPLFFTSVLKELCRRVLEMPPSEYYDEDLETRKRQFDTVARCFESSSLQRVFTGDDRLFFAEIWKIGFVIGRRWIKKVHISLNSVLVENVMGVICNEKMLVLQTVLSVESKDDVSPCAAMFPYAFHCWQGERLKDVMFGRQCAYVGCAAVGNAKLIKLCKGCRITRYCSKKCQKRDWKHTHKPKCQAVSRLYEMMSTVKIFGK